MKKEKIKELKTYLTENDLESNIDEIDDLDEKMRNSLGLAKIHGMYFDQFRKHFKDFDDKEVKKIIEEQDLIDSEFLKLNDDLDSEIQYVRGKAIQKLKDYVQLKRRDIKDFIQDCLEVYAE